MCGGVLMRWWQTSSSACSLTTQLTCVHTCICAQTPPPIACLIFNIPWIESWECWRHFQSLFILRVLYRHLPERLMLAFYQNMIFLPEKQTRLVFCPMTGYPTKSCDLNKVYSMYLTTKFLKLISLKFKFKAKTQKKFCTVKWSMYLLYSLL